METLNTCSSLASAPMSGQSKRSKAKTKVEADVKKFGSDMKTAGKDVEKAVEKGARDLKSAGRKIKKKV
jgi:ribosomal protein S20